MSEITEADDGVHDGAEPDATTFWEGRYREREQIWSGRPNRALVDVLDSIGVTPGTALDLGSGEGADSIWLAEQGWTVTGVDISTTALSRAEVHASDRGVAERIDWQQADLAEWIPSAEYDLVSACFLHSPVAFPREEVLRRAATAVAPGGYLLVVGHASFPSWSRDASGEADDGAADAHGHEGDENRAPDADQHEHGHGRGDAASSAPGGSAHTHRHGHDEAASAAPAGSARTHRHGHDDGELPTPEQVRTSLALPADAWDTVVAENRSREATGPDGQSAVLDDAILLLRRRA
jgi:SAM-dependent methyltransferase